LYLTGAAEIIATCQWRGTRGSGFEVRGAG
jgi:hypothetical protein